MWKEKTFINLPKLSINVTSTFSIHYQVYCDIAANVQMILDVSLLSAQGSSPYEIYLEAHGKDTHHIASS